MSEWGSENRGARRSARHLLACGLFFCAAAAIGETVFQDDFSEADATPINGKPADIGDAWYSGSAQNTVNGGSFIQEGSGSANSIAAFSRAPGPGETLVITVSTGSGSVFTASGWSGLTLATGGGASLSFGDSGSGSAWRETDGGASSGDASASNSVTITYSYDTGIWVLETAVLPGAATGTVSSGLAFDQIRFWDDGSGGSVIAYDLIEAVVQSTAAPETNVVSYVDWAVAHRLTSGRFGDGDGDGLINLHEFGNGGDPANAADRGFSPEVTVQSDAGRQWLYYTYPLRIGATNELAYSVESSETLASSTWTAVDVESLGENPGGYAPGIGAVSNRVEITSRAQAFARQVLRGAGADEWRGADISMVPRFEELGGQYRIGDLGIDPIHILMNYGMNAFRVRLFLEPDGAWDGAIQDLAYVTALGQRIRNAGAIFLLDLHYSDTWADPGNQSKPEAWASLSFSELEAQVESYSSNVIATLKQAGCLPDVVQVGNEITGGFLWPHGKIYNEPLGGWSNFTTLLKAGIRGCKQPLTEGEPLKIMIHIDRGGDPSGMNYFYTQLAGYGVQYDIIGLSFYPWWHGSSTALRNTINAAAVNFGKEVVIAETAYPWFSSYSTMEWPQTPAGQRQFVEEILQALRDVPNNRGKGVFWWYPEAVDDVPISVWEGGANALFDSSWNALPALEPF